MIKNGFYSYGSKALDGVDGGDSGVMVLRDGGILGGYLVLLFHWHLQLFWGEVEG
jgi:hypothetical protein